MTKVRKLLKIKQYEDGKLDSISDVVIIEESYEIILNGRQLVTISALPMEQKELAVGFLFSEGLLKNFKELIEINFKKGSKQIFVTAQIPAKRFETFFRTGTSGSALSAKLDPKSNFQIENEIDPSTTVDLMKKFQNYSELFKETGGVHSAGLIYQDEIRYFANDIGRHNAVDKVIGKAILQKEDLDKFTIFTSGRISSEIMQKIIRVKFSVIVSRSAPTSEAVRLGWIYNVVVIGFARGNRLNIYTGFQ